MKISRRHATIGGFSLLAGASINTSAQAKRERPLRDAIKSAKEREEVRDLVSRTVYRRAVDAVIWGLPLVGEDSVKQAAFRDGKANYNDIVWWPKGGSWKNQSPTPNVNTRYMYFFINTRQDGPVVVDIPPAVTGASFYGTIEDAWYVPLTDVGFEGKGGKFRSGCEGRRRVGTAGENLPVVDGRQSTPAAPPRHDRRYVQRSREV